MSKAKAQNCPSCKKEPYTKNIFVRCENKKCLMKTLDWFVIDFWNRIRIAPDDRNVMCMAMDAEYGNFYEHDERFEEGWLVEKADWMNPRYPDDE